MSSCLSGGGGRAYGFDLDMVMKSSTTSSPTMSASLSSSSSSASPSSTISESSNSPIAISTKKARSPRKRPNQTYTEAAAMLAKIYPNIFSAANNNNHPRRQNSKFSKPKISSDYLDVEPSELLPPFPVPVDTGFLLLRGPSPLSNNINNPVVFEESTKGGAAVSSIAKCCWSPSDYYREREPSSSTSPPPCVVDEDGDFDAESILDEEVQGEGIDSILGSSSSSSTLDGGGGEAAAATEESTLNYYADRIDPYLGYHPCSLLYGLNITSALRHAGNADWWCSPTVEMHNIVSNSKTTTQQTTTTTTAPENNKKNNNKKKEKRKKKVEKLQKVEEKLLALKGAEGSSKLVSSKSSCDPAEDCPSAAAAGGGGSSSCSPRPKATTSVGCLKPALSLNLNFEGVMQQWADGRSPFSEAPDSSESPADLIAKLSDIDLFSETAGTSGIREASVLRYKEKRRSRLFSKKIRYEVRKVNADIRPRMKASGRFVKKDDEQ